MRRHQRGITTLGWIILLIPFAIVGYAGVRVAPIYLNYMKVVHTLDQVSAEIANEGATADQIRISLSRHYETESLDYPDVKDLSVKRVGTVWEIEANYDDQAPLFANIFILITFDKVVRLKGGIE